MEPQSHDSPTTIKKLNLMDIHQVSLPTAWTRRRILGWGATSAAGTIIAGFAEAGQQTTATDQQPSQALAPDSTPVVIAPLQTTRREDFLPYLHDNFRLGATLDCTLVEVSALQKHPKSISEFSSFTLLFEVPVGFVLQSKIHQLLHAHLGPMELFLSPVGDSQRHLEAVFSQRV